MNFTAKKIKQHITDPELLFILGSNKDTRGRRILVRYGGTDNIIHKGDDLGDPSLSLIGIGAPELADIKQFLKGEI